MLITFGLMECYYINLKKDEFRKSLLIIQRTEIAWQGNIAVTNSKNL